MKLTTGSSSPNLIIRNQYPAIAPSSIRSAPSQTYPSNVLTVRRSQASATSQKPMLSLKTSTALVDRRSRAQLPDPYAAPCACESIQTDLLWRRVSRARTMPPRAPPHFQRATASSNRRRRGAGGSQVSSTASSESSQPAALVGAGSRSDTHSTEATTISFSNKSRVPRINDSSFRETVLPAYGISISIRHTLASAYEHFATEDPARSGYEDRVAEWYQQKQGHADCRIWLSLDASEAENVANQYANLRKIRAREAKFSYRGKKYFFLEDDVHDPDGRGRCASTYFELEWAPNPDGKHLLCPPMVSDTHGSLFRFNTNPDCTYWLTIQRMNAEYRAAVRDYTFVMPHAEVTAPYLTVEFKKESQDFEAAENQLAVSVTLVVYNRFRLRLARLEAQGKSIANMKVDDFDDIKHYGIAFNGVEASIYHARPRITMLGEGEVGGISTLQWTGCKLTKLKNVKITQFHDVLALRSWVNEIHHWGLSQHSQQFVIDVKGLLLQAEGGSRISLSNEDKTALGIA